MKINRLNYEAFFLDHLEGRLTRAQKKELQEFLAANPDLAPELDDFESIHLDKKEKIIFHDKPGIKKNEGELTPVAQLIALMEGDLAPQEAVKLKKEIESDEYQRVQSQLLQKTKLFPDLSIRFPEKNKLKRKGRIVFMWRYVAAAAVLIIGLTIIFRNIPDKNQNENVVQKNTPAVPSVTPSINKKVKEEILADEKKPVFKSSQKKLKSQEQKQVEKNPQQINLTPILTANEISIPAQEESLQTEQIASDESAQPVFAPVSAYDYKDVFSEDEWNELRALSVAQKSSLVQQLATEGISRLGELTGVQLRFPDREKQQNVFAFSVGKFEVRHVSTE